MISFELMKNSFIIALAGLCLISFGFSSCVPDPIPIRNLYWIEGDWKGRIRGGMMYEEWEFGVDSALIGNSWVMVRTDTVFKETMQIVKDEEDVFYIVKVEHNNAPISFKLTNRSPKGFFFENAEHDFPSRIVYANTLGDMMLVRIEGIRDSVGDTARFFMHRNILFPPDEEDGMDFSF